MTEKAMIIQQDAPQAMAVFNPEASLRETLQRVSLVGKILEKVMKDGIHYGEGFPGDTKKNLLKAGADSLGVAFKLAPEFNLETVDMGGDHREVRVTCVIRHQDTGRVIGQGVGSCSTKESKYRWRNAALKCPACGGEFIIQGKPEYAPKKDGRPDPAFAKGGWLCYKKKGGCGAGYGDEDPLITKQPRGKVENTDPADQWNTVLKMAKKRAYVDGMITATGCSDMFTQDLEEIDKSLVTTTPVAAPAAKASEKAPGTGKEPEKAAPGVKTPGPAQQASQGGNSFTPPADENPLDTGTEGAVPTEVYVTDMLKLAKDTPQVLEAFSLAIKYQGQGPFDVATVKRLRTLRDERLDALKA